MSKRPVIGQWRSCFFQREWLTFAPPRKVMPGKFFAIFWLFFLKKKLNLWPKVAYNCCLSNKNGASKVNLKYSYLNAETQPDSPQESHMLSTPVVGNSWSLFGLRPVVLTAAFAAVTKHRWCLWPPITRLPLASLGSLWMTIWNENSRHMVKYLNI